MPFHLPSLKTHHKDKDKEQVEGFVPPPNPTSPISPTTTFVTSPTTEHPHPVHRASTLSNSSSSNAPSSILKKPASHGSSTSTSTPISEYTNGSGSGGAGSTSPFLSKRLSTALSLPRTDTISSYDYSDGNSTRASSISDAGNNCPLPASSEGHRFPFFVMTLSSMSTLSFIALPVYMRPMVLEAINKAWRKGVGKITEVPYESGSMKREGKTCEGGVWEVTMKDNAWVPQSQDKVSSKRILINLMTAFAKEGYSLVSSYRTSSKDSAKDTLSFLRGEPDPEPIFMAIAFYSHDRIWIIDAEADVGQAVEEGIHKYWDAGIRDARVRERHCREIRLKGNPWTSHATNALISSRIIHLVIMKHITHMDRGYDFVGSVDMSDSEEGEMPVTFYRRRWGSQRAVWSMDQ